ncbi:MAG: hypothetical protein U0797_22380 [Gemmataceae bacterium]
MNPMNAKGALEAYFFEARCKVLDLAAILDRIGRGEGGNGLTDPRLAKLREALDVLRDESPARAERVQQVFSLGYDPEWERPKPRL